MNGTEPLLLRKDPLFEIQIQKDGFMIQNQADGNDSGFYKFDEIGSLHLEKKRINWVVTISSLILDALTGSATGGVFNNRTQLRLNYNTIEKRIILDSCDIKATELAIRRIKYHLK